MRFRSLLFGVRLAGCSHQTPEQRHGCWPYEHWSPTGYGTGACMPNRLPDGGVEAPFNSAR